VARSITDRRSGETKNHLVTDDHTVTWRKGRGKSPGGRRKNPKLRYERDGVWTWCNYSGLLNIIFSRIAPIKKKESQRGRKQRTKITKRLWTTVRRYNAK